MPCKMISNEGAGYLSVAAEVARRSWVAWMKKKKKSARRSRRAEVVVSSRWAMALGPTVDALVTSVDGGGAATVGVLPNSRTGVAGLGGPGMRAGRRGAAAREPWSCRPLRCHRGGAGGRRRSSPPRR